MLLSKNGQVGLETSFWVLQAIVEYTRLFIDVLNIKGCSSPTFTNEHSQTFNVYNETIWFGVACVVTSNEMVHGFSALKVFPEVKKAPMHSAYFLNYMVESQQVIRQSHLLKPNVSRFQPHVLLLTVSQHIVTSYNITTSKYSLNIHMKNVRLSYTYLWVEFNQNPKINHAFHILKVFS